MQGVLDESTDFWRIQITGENAQVEIRIENENGFHVVACHDGDQTALKNGSGKRNRIFQDFARNAVEENE
jgi:hypothetical protein